MDHIPNELLHKIFIKLGLKDKLEYAFVCRRWYDILDQGSLLHTLNISHRVFSKLKQVIERQPYRANQVEYLTIDTCESVDFDKRILCNMFPNLREITLPGNSIAHGTPNYLDTPFRFKHPTSKLEKIVDSGQCELTCHLAMSNMCSNLKSLDLKFPSSFGERNRRILVQLKNMPLLETLTLFQARAKLTDLEILHHNLPSVKSLRLSVLIMVSGESPHNIIPATRIAKLYVQLTYIRDLNAHIQFYNYLTKKYPSVSDPICVDGISPGSIDYVRNIYNEGILPLYQSRGPQANTFTFSTYCDGLDAFRKFDESRMKLKELKVGYVDMNENENWREDTDSDGGRFPLDELVQSQQSKSIQKFILNNIIPAPLEMMMNMEALTYLEIDFSISYAEYDYKFTGKIDFSQLVDVCPPTLTDLIITSMHLDCHKTPPSNITSIQNLTLSNVEITEATTITGKSFPKLSVLHLAAIITGHLAISLPTQHLNEAKIVIQCPENESRPLAINTVSDGKPQRNVIWPDNKATTCGAREYRSEKPDYDCTECELVNFTCASVEKASYSIYHKNSGDEECDDDDDDEY